MVDKLNTYMISGVKEFWIVDPGKKTVLVYNFKDFEIDKYLFYKQGERIKSFYFEGPEVDVDLIFES